MISDCPPATRRATALLSATLSCVLMAASGCNTNTESERVISRTREVRLASIPASEETTKQTGVVVWNAYRRDPGVMYKGLDGTGRVLFDQIVMATKDAISVEVTRPTKFAIQTLPGQAPISIGEPSPQALALMTRFEADVSVANNNVEFSGCWSAIK
jgi:hypothetical protein